VFDYLINRNVIPMAIYREKYAMDNSRGFIYTNPSPHAPIL